MGNAFSIHLIRWHDGEPLLRAVQRALSVCDQRASTAPGCDGLDEVSRHALALNVKGGAIGYWRITSPLHQTTPCIGRIAVLPEWCGKRVEMALLESLLDYAHSQHYPEVEIHAQLQQLPFYQRHLGFDVKGEEFIDASNAYIKMRLLL